MTKEFYSLDEIQKYYDETTNTYVFKEGMYYIDLVVFNFNLDVDANISANNIKAWGIKANNIDAHNIDSYDTVAKNINACGINAYDIEADDIETYEDIKAWNIYAHNIIAKNIIADNIYAHDISYWGLCFATQNIECHSIEGRRDNHKHFALDGYFYIDGSTEITSKESLFELYKQAKSHTRTTKQIIDNKQQYEQIEKELKALEIIKTKNVDIEYIKTCCFGTKSGFKEYNAYVGHDEEYELSQEEYKLLEEVLEDE